MTTIYSLHLIIKCTWYLYVQVDVAISYCCYVIKFDCSTCLHVTTIYFVSSYYKKSTRDIFMYKLMCHVATMLLRSMLSIARVIATCSCNVTTIYSLHLIIKYTWYLSTCKLMLLYRIAAMLLRSMQDQGACTWQQFIRFIIKKNIYIYV